MITTIALSILIFGFALYVVVQLWRQWRGGGSCGSCGSCGGACGPKEKKG